MRAEQRVGVSVGDRVAVEVFQSCRQCANRRGGEYRRCVRMYGFIPAEPLKVTPISVPGADRQGGR